MSTKQVIAHKFYSALIADDHAGEADESPRFNALLSKVRQEASDSAYRERNQVVAALAKCFPSVVTKTDIPGWDPAWHNCVYVTLPTGQASWHFHDNDSDLFRDIQRGEMKWDGHTTPEKYERLDKLKIGEASNETILGTHLNSQDLAK